MSTKRTAELYRESHDESHHPPVVIVSWRDSYRASDGWTAREESIDSSRTMVADPIFTAGFLVDDTAAGVVIASGYNHHADDVEGAMAIARSAIVGMTVLLAAREEKTTDAAA